MTRPRFDNHSTEFGLWLRSRPEIDSSKGFVATNLDYVWQNYKTGDWMFIEEKRHGASPSHWQHQIFQMLHRLCRNDPAFHGFHLIQFENTSPDDGSMWLDHKLITIDELLLFLTFLAP
jgi:hypothetical protein